MLVLHTMKYLLLIFIVCDKIYFRSMKILYYKVFISELSLLYCWTKVWGVLWLSKLLTTPNITRVHPKILNTPSARSGTNHVSNKAIVRIRSSFCFFHFFLFSIVSLVFFRCFVLLMFLFGFDFSFLHSFLDLIIEDYCVCSEKVYDQLADCLNICMMLMQF